MLENRFRKTIRLTGERESGSVEPDFVKCDFDEFKRDECPAIYIYDRSPMSRRVFRFQIPYNRRFPTSQNVHASTRSSIKPIYKRMDK